MNTRIARIEADIAEIKIDLAVIKARFATKADIAELKRSNAADLTGMKSSIAKARTSIIISLIAAVFLAQLPAILTEVLNKQPPWYDGTPSPRFLGRTSELLAPSVPNAADSNTVSPAEAGIDKTPQPNTPGGSA